MTWSPDSLAALPLPGEFEYEEATHWVQRTIHAHPGAISHGLMAELSGFASDEELRALSPFLNFLGTVYSKNNNLLLDPKTGENSYELMTSLSLGWMAGAAIVRVVHQERLPFREIGDNIVLRAESDEPAEEARQHLVSLHELARRGLGRMGPSARGIMLTQWANRAAEEDWANRKLHFMTAIGVVVDSAYMAHFQAIEENKPLEPEPLATQLGGLQSGRLDWSIDELLSKD